MSVPRVTSPYGVRRSNGKIHRGIDHAATQGSLVAAMAAGLAWSQNEPDGFGEHVRILTPAREVLISPAHMSSTLVPRGHQDPADWLSAPPSAVAVSARQAIGRSGNTGRSTGPHTHSEVRTRFHRHGMSSEDDSGWRSPTTAEIWNLFNPLEEDEMTDARMAELKAFIKQEARAQAVQASRVIVAALAFGSNAKDDGTWLRDDVPPWTTAIPNTRSIENRLAAIEGALSAGDGTVDADAIAQKVADVLSSRLRA